MGGRHTTDVGLREIPSEVLRQYPLPVADYQPIATGLIHRSYFLLDTRGDRIAVAQRLHSAFTAAVNTDIDAVTRHLTDQGFQTPTLIRTVTNTLSAEYKGDTWRILSYVDGTPLAEIDSESQAHSAGRLLGNFHAALSGLKHQFVFHREIHNTKAHLDALRAVTENPPNHSLPRPLHHEAKTLGQRILDTSRLLPQVPSLPRRILHGDPKLSNILFSSDGTDAECFVDLDGVGHHFIAYELGDAMRSWCAKGPEATPTFDPDLFEAALNGYYSAANRLVSTAERESIVIGLQTVCLELAARFCTDAVNDRYFSWDPGRYNSRVEHNLARAKGQLVLANAIAKQSSALQTIVSAL